MPAPTVQSHALGDAHARPDSGWDEPKLLAMLERGNADAVLDFGARRLPVHGAILSLSSEPLAGMLEAAANTSKRPKMLKVEDDSPEGWFQALELMYPLTSSTPALDWGNVAAMLPVIHKYDCSHLLDVCRVWLEDEARTLSAVTGSAAHVCTWLELGDRLQLDYIKTKALAFIKSEISAGRTHLLGETASLSKLTVSTLASVTALAAGKMPDPFLGSTFRCTYCQSLFAVKAASGYAKQCCPACQQGNPYHVVVP